MSEFKRESTPNTEYIVQRGIFDELHTYITGPLHEQLDGGWATLPQSLIMEEKFRSI